MSSLDQLEVTAKRSRLSFSTGDRIMLTMAGLMTIPAILALAFVPVGVLSTYGVFLLMVSVAGGIAAAGGLYLTKLG